MATFRSRWITALFVFGVLSSNFQSVRAAGEKVKVVETKKGSTVFLAVQNPYICEATVSLDLNLLNMSAQPAGPISLIIPPEQTLRATVLKIDDPKQAWKYNYKFKSQFGTSKAKFNPSLIYDLPFAAGSCFNCSQGHEGKLTHSGRERFALDFALPVGSPVHAARAGKVVFIQDGFGPGKFESTFKEKANYIYVRHADATLGEYFHLSKNSIKVRVGEEVMAGQLLAHSGNSGYSTGPHLHFMVFRPLDGKTAESLPVRFRAKEGLGIIPEMGKSYTALEPKDMKGK